MRVKANPRRKSLLLTQMHRHLMTRAQLHGCTLVANRLSLDGSHAAVPYKAISTPIRDATRKVVGVLAVFRIDTQDDFQLRDAEVLELLARKASQIIHASFDEITGMLTSAGFLAQAAAKLNAKTAAAHGLLYIDIDQLNVVNEITACTSATRSFKASRLWSAAAGARAPWSRGSEATGSLSWCRAAGSSRRHGSLKNCAAPRFE